MDRLPREEFQTLEFKRTLAEMKEIVETVCTFANTKGGRILIGVDDSGRVLGVELGFGNCSHFDNLANTRPSPAVTYLHSLCL